MNVHKAPSKLGDLRKHLALATARVQQCSVIRALPDKVPIEFRDCCVWRKLANLDAPDRL